jgi:hypothetical protein
MADSDLLKLYNWYARYTEGTATVVPKGLILSLIAVCILTFTGWKGWAMCTAVESALRMRTMFADIRRGNRRGARLEDCPQPCGGR